jgi:Utp21 specific WD40 associated putative domain
MLQARNKPIEPPKKPEAAPFFLPAAPGASAPAEQLSNPFAATSAPPASLRMQGPAEGSAAGDELAELVDSAGDKQIESQQRQVMRRQGTLSTRLWQEDPLMCALAVGAHGGSYAGAVQWLRAASAVQVERSVLSISAEEPFDEVRRHAGLVCASLSCAQGIRKPCCLGSWLAQPSSTLLRWSQHQRASKYADSYLSGPPLPSRLSIAQEDSEAVALLLRYVLAQLRARTNFDHAQGLLALVLRVHGGRVAAVEALSALALELHGALACGWAAIDEDLQAVRCMAALFGHMQM